MCRPLPTFHTTGAVPESVKSWSVGSQTGQEIKFFHRLCPVTNCFQSAIPSKCQKLVFIFQQSEVLWLFHLKIHLQKAILDLCFFPSKRLQPEFIFHLRFALWNQLCLNPRWKTPVWGILNSIWAGAHEANLSCCGNKPWSWPHHLIHTQTERLVAGSSTARYAERAFLWVFLNSLNPLLMHICGLTWWECLFHFSHSFFLTSGPICSACAEHQCGSETTAPLHYPWINLIDRAWVFFAPFLLVNGSTVVIRSVFAPHAGLSHAGQWLDCTQWVTGGPLGSRVARWPIMKSERVGFCRCLACPAMCASPFRIIFPTRCI